MRLLRQSDVEIRGNDRVFRYSRVHAVAIALIVLGVAGWVAFHAYTAAWKPGYYIVAAIVLFLDLMRRFVTARFRSSNWLVRLNDLGVYVQFRSYLNYHLPAEDLTVVFIPFGEIRSARLIKERVTVPDPQGQNRTQTQYLRHVELELAGDVTQLSSALDAERGEQAPQEKHWYGRSSTLYQDYPVRMESRRFCGFTGRWFPALTNFLMRCVLTPRLPIQSRLLRTFLTYNRSAAMSSRNNCVNSLLAVRRSTRFTPRASSMVAAWPKQKKW